MEERKNMRGWRGRDILAEPPSNLSAFIQMKPQNLLRSANCYPAAQAPLCHPAEILTLVTIG